MSGTALLRHLTSFPKKLHIFHMANTYAVKEAQTHLPGLVREAEEGEVVTITRHAKPVAFVLGAQRLAAIAETMELLSNPAARAAIEDARAGRGRTYSLDQLPG